MRSIPAIVFSAAFLAALACGAPAQSSNQPPDPVIQSQEEVIATAIAVALTDTAPRNAPTGDCQPPRTDLPGNPAHCDNRRHRRTNPAGPNQHSFPGDGPDHPRKTDGYHRANAHPTPHSGAHLYRPQLRPEPVRARPNPGHLVGTHR